MSDEYYQPRRVNVVAILVVTLVTAGLAAGSYFLYRWQVIRNAEDLLAQSRQAEEEGKLGKAAEYSMQYLALRPDQHKEFSRYADLSQKLAANPTQQLRAIFLIDQALRKEPDRDDLRRSAARLAVSLGRFREGMYKDALGHVEVLRKNKKDDDELLHLEARATLGLRKYEQAAELYGQVTKDAPGNVRAWEERIALERDPLKNPTGADDLALRMIEVNPKSLPAFRVAAQHFILRGNLDKALELVTRTQKELGEKSADLALLGAELAAFKGRAVEARERLAAALKDFPEDVTMRLTAARVEARLKDPKKALELLAPFRKSLPENPEQLCELGSLLLDLGGDPDEIKAIQRRLDVPATKWALEILDGHQRMREQKWGAARVVLEKLLHKRLPGATWGRQVDMMLAECYRALGNPDQQAEAANRVLKSDPNSVRARQALAESMGKMGKTEKAIQQFSHLAEGEPDNKVARVRVLALTQMTRKEKERDWTEVEKALAALPEKDKDSLEVSVLRAEIAVAQGRLDHARRVAEAARDRDPKLPGPWLFLFEVARMERKPARALGVLEEAERRIGPRVDWSIARVRLAVSTGGKDGLDQLKQLEEQRQKLATGPDRDALTSRLAMAFLQLGDGSQGEKLYAELADTQKGNLEVRVLLAERALRAGKVDLVKKYAAEAEEAEGPEGPVGSYLKALASLSTGQKGHDEARNLLARAGKQRPSWYRVPSMEGEIDDREGKREAAAKKYVAAIELGETRLAVLQRAVFLLFELRRYTEADALARRLPEPVRMTGDMGRLSGLLALVGKEDEVGVTPEQRRTRALEVAREIVKAGPKDFRNYVFLGQMAGETKEAEQALLKAREMAPGEVIPWVALIQFYSRSDVARAKKELAEAERKLPADKATLALASCHEVLGQVKEAQKYYQAALDAQPNQAGVLASLATFHTRHGLADEAGKLWRKVLAPETQASDADRRAARRSLAILLALSGSYPSYQEAVRLIDLNLKTREAIEDRRVEALVKATQPAERREAIRLFERLSPLAATTPPEMQLLLARLCEADPDLKVKALDYVEALVRNSGENPAHLTYAAMAYLRQGQNDQAATVIDQLAKRVGNTFELAELRARLLKARGKPDEARRLIQDEVKGKDDRLVSGAMILEAIGESAAAEAMLRHVAFKLKRPEGLVLLADHLGRRKQVAEALDLCEQAWPKSRAEDVALVCIRVLRANGGTAEQQERVAGWLKAAQEKNPTSVTLLACQAELEDMRSRYDAVIALYRRVLGLQPDNVVALNNLAYYLSVKEGKHDEALKMLDKVIAARGPLGEILDTRGLIRLGAGKADEALQDFQAAVKQDPSPVKLLHLARGHAAREELSAARSTFRKALALGLKEDQLPPLERGAWKELTDRLGIEDSKN